MRGNGSGNGKGAHADGTSGGELSLAALNGKIAELKVLYEQGQDVEYEQALSRVAKLFHIPKGKLRNWVENGSGDDQPGPLEIPDPDQLLLDFEIDPGNLPTVADAVRDLFRDSGEFYDRGVPVRVTAPAAPDALPEIDALNVDAITNEVHKRRRVVVRRREGKRSWLVTKTLPERIGKLYLAKKGEWQLPPLQGITTAPLLSEDGGIRTAEGYDQASGLYCVGIPTLAVPEHPTEAAAREALFALRREFRTFPFADATRKTETMLDVKEGELIDVDVVDLDAPIGRDESTLVTAVLAAVCRANLLSLAPAVIALAAQLSGSGSGKGLLLCGVSMIAFGVLPLRFTAGGSQRNPEELEKRLSAALLEAWPWVLLENFNNATLQSETLESALTDRPCHTRPFGKLKMVQLNSTAMIGMTGNGSTPGRDLVRKMTVITLDPKIEVPALRKFPRADKAWLAHLKTHRAALLTHALTIWRFGRRLDVAGKLPRGEALGSYDEWCRHCRDPLLALGCEDPVGRIHELRGADPLRERVAELFSVWWEYHKEEWVAQTSRNQPAGVKVLADAVRAIADPDERGPQYLRTVLKGLAGMRAAGFVCERFWDPARPAVPATYRIMRTG
jgi:hypothetical protein